jgi:glycosyltransferase involved in cell wall biosynthesis
MLHYLARELSARGNQLDLIAFDGETQHPSEGKPYEHFGSVQLLPERMRSGLDYLLRLRRVFPNQAGESWNPSMWRAIAQAVLEHDFDLVHFLGSIQVYEFRNAVWSHLPTVIVPADSLTLLHRRRLAVAGGARRLRAWLEWKVARGFERTIYQGFGRVIVVGEGDRAELADLAAGLPVEVIPNGVDLPVEYRIPRAPPTLVFVGNYTYAPNVEAAIWLAEEILPRVQAVKPAARLLLVGADPPGKVRRLANDSVEVTGWVPAVGSYLRQATCFVSPLTSGSGMHNKVLEALAQGVPVVATPISCDGLSLTAKEHVLLGTTAESLADQVLRLIGQPRLAERIGQAGREHVRAHFSWRSVADRYVNVFESVVEEFGRGLAGRGGRSGLPSGAGAAAGAPAATAPKAPA